MLLECGMKISRHETEALQYRPCDHELVAQYQVMGYQSNTENKAYTCLMGIQGNRKGLHAGDFSVWLIVLEMWWSPEVLGEAHV